MYKPGDVIVVDFPGVTGVKRRPAVIVSSNLYQSSRPDVIVGLVTSQIASATGPTDWPLQDWQSADLRQASAFRCFLHTAPRADIVARIGRLSDLDWKGIQASVEKALGPFPRKV